MPNNREIAVLIWVAAVVALVLLLLLRDQGGRRSLQDLLSASLSPYILVPVGIYLLVITLAVLIGQWAKLWNNSLVTDTAFWTMTAGFPLLFRFERAARETAFFRRTLGEVLGFTLVVQALLSLSIFDLWAEALVVAPLSLLFGLMAGVAELRDHFGRQVALLALPLTLMGFVLLGFSIHHVATEPKSVEVDQILRIAFLPVWMTVGVVPYVYLLGLWLEYQKMFLQIDLHGEDSPRRDRLIAKAALVRSFGVQVEDMQHLSQGYSRTLASLGSITKARQFIAARRAEIRQRASAARATQDRLTLFAGVDRADDEGRRLDRRGFQETQDALMWLHTCHMGWWRHDNRYVEGLLDRISDPDHAKGLTLEAGYQEYVAKDGSWWYCWRRAESNWVFAIGASSPPSDQWQFDGPEPPEGPPGQASGWRHHLDFDNVSPNWE